MKRKTLMDFHSSSKLFLLVFVTYAIVYLTKNCFAAAMAAIVNEGIMTKSQTGLISAVFYLVYAPFQVVGGIAADRYSPNKLILIGIAGAAVSNLLIYLLDGYVAMMIIWTFNGIIQFGVWPSVFKIVTTQLAPQTRVKCIMYITFSSSLGLLLSYITAIFTGNWKNNFLLSAVALVVIAIVFYLVYKHLEKDMVEEEPQEKTERNDKKTHDVNVYALMLKAGIPLVLLVAVIYSMFNLGIKTLAPVMLMESYEKVSPAIGNALNIILILTSMAGTILGRNRFFNRFSTVGSIAFLFGITLVFLATIMFVGKLLILLIVIALALLMLFMAAAALFFSYVAFAFNKFGYSGTLSGVINCMFSLGIVLANYVFAKMADTSGWGVTTRWWLILGVFAFILALASIPMWKKFIKYSENI